MAQLALGVVGSAIGGPIGGFIGAAIGSFIDNALFPQKQQGPRLSDLTLQVSTYGKAVPLAFGPENRITGNVIWASGLIETPKAETSGGFKGGPSVQVTEYSYRVSVAVLLCEGVIDGVRKIWANSQLIYDADEVTPATPGATPQGFLGGVIPLNFYQLTQSTHVLFDTITVYPGDFDQDPDPTIESFLGVGEVPGYRGRSYVLLKDFQLGDYGNRLPNLEFLVVADEDASIGGSALEIIGRCGIDTNTVSASQVKKNLRGYMIGRESSGTGGLQPLALFGGFDIAEVSGALRLTRRDGAPIAVIQNYELGGHQGDEGRPEAIRWNRNAETQLPRESAVTFPDPDRDFQVNTQVARRSGGSAQNNLGAELPITMGVDDGRQVADRALWEAWQGRQTAVTATTDRWIGIQAGKKYIFETAAGLEPLRVTRRTRGANGVIQLELRRDRGEIYRSAATGVSAAVPSKGLGIPGASEIILLDIPILLDADDNSGFYYAIVGSETGWRGADVLRALTVSDDYFEVSPIGFEATVGDVTGTLADGATTGFDDVTTLTVVLRRDDMTLGSVDDDALAAGQNACFVGDPDDTTEGEIIQFGDATLVGPGATYELTHLLRGLKCTEFAAPNHGSGEIFVLLEPGAIKRANYGSSDLGQEHAFKAVSLLTNIEDAVAVLFTNTGVGLRPCAPSDLTVVGDTGTDLELSWTREARLESGELGLGETPETYTVRIMNAAGTVVLRETTVTTTAFTYTVAMQTADFGAPPSDLRWRAAQFSTLFGNGKFTESNGPVP